MLKIENLYICGWETQTLPENQVKPVDIKINCVPLSNIENVWMFLPSPPASRLHFSNDKKQIKKKSDTKKNEHELWTSLTLLIYFSCYSQNAFSKLQIWTGQIPMKSLYCVLPNSSPWPTSFWMLVPVNVSSLSSCYLLLIGPAECAFSKCALSSLSLPMLCPLPEQDRDNSCSSLPRTNSYLSFRSLSDNTCTKEVLLERLPCSLVPNLIEMLFFQIVCHH